MGKITDILNGATNDPDGASITGVAISIEDDGRYLIQLTGTSELVGATGLYFDEPHGWEDALEDLLTDRREEADR